MPIIKVTKPDLYDIVIENGILGSCGSLIRKVSSAATALVISDSNVAPLYMYTVLASLKGSGFNTESFVFPAGEKSKTLSTVNDMLGAMCKASLTRSDIVVALGGGICGDLAGFASAIYLRGVDFVQIPTSLLAQVDASVGGKTGCDLEFGKNLAGAFHNPKAVLIDPMVLSTLPKRHFADGMAEAVKAAVIKSEKLFKMIQNGADITDIIEQCVIIKRDTVENDFKESGERMLLNFGHTIGHAIELHHNFDGITHGEAVAIGMVLISRASEKNGICIKGTTDKLINALISLNLPVDTDIPLGTLLSLCSRDKKTRGKTINLVLPKQIGSAFTKSIELEKIGEFFGI